MFHHLPYGVRRKMAFVEFSSPLVKFTNNLARCEVNGGTVGEAMKEVGERFPEIKGKLLREDGTLRAFFIIFADEKDIRMLERERTPVRGDSIIRIVPAIAGGQPDRCHIKQIDRPAAHGDGGGARRRQFSRTPKGETVLL